MAITGFIKSLFDPNGNAIFPRTKTGAVTDASGQNVDVLLNSKADKPIGSFDIKNVVCAAYISADKKELDGFIPFNIPPNTNVSLTISKAKIMPTVWLDGTTAELGNKTLVNGTMPTTTQLLTIFPYCGVKFSLKKTDGTTWGNVSNIPVSMRIDGGTLTIS